LRHRLQILNSSPDNHGSFARIEDAIAAIRAGNMVIVADDKDRENGGDLTIAAEKVTPAAINFMARYGRGLVCLAMTPERLDELEIPLMVSQNSSRFETAFCVSIEAKAGTTTGISAADRAATVLAAIDPATKPSDLSRPRPHLSFACPNCRSAGTGWANRGCSRPGAHGRSAACRSNL
jgi:3,4-dihydroxy-2-butanone 4-phosphate synthase